MAESTRTGDEEWKELVAKYTPEHARVCNCGRAYEYPCGEAIVDGERVNDFWVCPAGCSAAQIAAKEHVAQCVLKIGYGAYYGRID